MKPIRDGRPLAACIAAGIILGSGGSSQAQSPGARPTAFHIRPGLWEFHDTPKVSGDTVMPEMMLAKIPVSQRAHYLVEMRNMLSQPSTERECLSQSSFEQRLFSLADGCTRRVTSNSPSRMKVVTECRAKDGGTTQDNIRQVLASSPENVTTSFHAVTAREGKIMVVDSIEIGHWLASDCGKVHGIVQLP